MTFSIDILVVGVIVAGALLWAGRATFQTVKKQGTCSSCGSSGECPVAKNPELLEDLAESQIPVGASCLDLARPVDGNEPES